ncbi:MAG TPA: ABC transporter permease [Acetobacteraceae bacterium]|nr:ABC transporter permease [Acetobacteraceae bacterium]
MSPARLSVAEDGGATVIALGGELTAAGLGPVWQRALAAARRTRSASMTIDLGAAEALDSAGATLLIALEQAFGGTVEWRGLTERRRGLIERLRAAIPQGPLPRPSASRSAAPGFRQTLATRIAFFGQTVLAALALPAKLRFLRAADFGRLGERAGYQAVPLVGMLGFLIGMILAFQSAVPMRQFGADLYVANLVSISLFRELGPLLCATILAGRTGSAFAAELGTMSVNEEISALTTMGIDPETMLVLPRVAVAMLVMPALTILMDIVGLLGMGFVLVLFGFTPGVILAQVASFTGPADLFLGLVKSVVFGAAIGIIGCRAGLTTGGGPRAVGEAATSAVVGGIVATILLDGLFAVMTYRLGI